MGDYDIYFDDETSEDNMVKGKLISVQLPNRPPGQMVKMYEDDAIRQGFITGKNLQKVAKKPTENKMLEPAENKQAEQVDDFTVISGIGPATARALVANGIKTFDQLRETDYFPFLSERTHELIEEWKRG